MPWKESNKMDQRVEFAMKAVGASNFRELCREYGISAPTGYKWMRRFLAHGRQGMAEESRRPKAHAQQLSEPVICAMIRLKLAHPHWGPRKIQELYRRQREGPLPSESSFKRILAKVGLTQPRRRRRAVPSGRLAVGRVAQKPNDIWTVDFKGWWKDARGLRVEPLTVRDEYSRMLLEMKAMPDCRGQSVRACFERLFQRYGLPAAIRSDNGAPFANTRALWGLTRLSAWWLALGIDLERSRPGCPQDNGAHERMHRDIRRELQAGRVGQDQAAFDLWRQEYNEERPHQALGMKMPTQLYQPSIRVYTGTPEDLDYGAVQVRRVHGVQGYISFQQERIFLSTALSGWSVGLKPRPDGLIEVWFAALLLGCIDPATLSFQAVRSDSLKASQTNEQTKNINNQV